MSQESSRSKKRRTNPLRNMTVFSYNEAHYAVMSAVLRERNWPMDQKTVQQISEEADEWLRRAHDFYGKKFDASIYDTDEKLYRLYRQLRLELGFIQVIPREFAVRFWVLFWNRAVEDPSIKAKERQEHKLWRDQVHERVKSRFKYDLLNNRLFEEFSPAVRSFYESSSGEISLPLSIKPAGGLPSLANRSSRKTPQKKR
jgi:hypothetical protein